MEERQSIAEVINKPVDIFVCIYDDRNLWAVYSHIRRHVVTVKNFWLRARVTLQDFKMAAATRDSSRFAGVKTFSEKFSQPEVDAEGRVRKVGSHPFNFSV